MQLTLPDDVLLVVLSNLQTADLCSAACVCRQWRRVCTSTKELWTQLKLRAAKSQVTDSQLLALVARAQGGLRSLTFSNEEVTDSQALHKMSEATLAAIVDASPELTWLTGFATLNDAGAATALGMESPAEAVRVLKRPNAARIYTPDALTRACLCLQLCGMSATSVNPPEFVAQVLSLMETLASHRRFLAAALHALCTCYAKIHPQPADDTSRALWMRACNALTVFLDDEPVVVTCFRLAILIDNRIVSSQSAACFPAVVVAMRARASSAPVQEYGCQALCNMTHNNTDNKVKAGSAGAIECVVAAMRAHAGHAGVQEHGCRALICLTSNNADNKVKAGSAGAIECVAAAMRAHAVHAGVQELAAAALKALALLEGGRGP